MNESFRYKDYKPYYFWQERPFTQWARDDVQFVENDIKFNCCEQYMMYHKAMLFGDVETANKIMNTIHPRDQKALGRSVKGFSQIAWDNKKESIVFMGNLLKFSQNPQYKSQLMYIYNSGYFFVEASPYDTIWGIGINPEDAKAGVEWKGENLLGKALTFCAVYFTLHQKSES